VFFPPSYRSRVEVASVPVFLALIVLVVALFIVLDEQELYMEIGSYRWKADSALKGVLITVMNKVWSIYAKTINDLENFKTTTEYEEALVWKIFTFQIINSFLPLVTAAHNGTMEDLHYEMLSVFLAKQGVEFSLQHVLPIIKHKWHQRQHKFNADLTFSGNVVLDVVSGTINTAVTAEAIVKELGHNLQGLVDGSQTEEERNLHKQELGTQAIFGDELLGETEEEAGDARHLVLGHFIMQEPEEIINKYADQTIQFAYMTCFANSFPLAPLIAFINNIFVLRFDIRNTIFVTRRNQFDRDTNGFGAWLDIFSFVSLLAIFFNCFIIYRTSDMPFDLYGLYTWFDGGDLECAPSAISVGSITNGSFSPFPHTVGTFTNGTFFPIDDGTLTAAALLTNTADKYPKCQQNDACDRLVCIYSHYHVKLVCIGMVLSTLLFIKWFLQIAIPDMPQWVLRDLGSSQLSEQLESLAENAQNTGESSLFSETQRSLVSASTSGKKKKKRFKKKKKIVVSVAALPLHLSGDGYEYADNGNDDASAAEGRFSTGIDLSSTIGTDCSTLTSWKDDSHELPSQKSLPPIRNNSGRPPTTELPSQKSLPAGVPQHVGLPVTPAGQAVAHHGTSSPQPKATFEEWGGACK
jgi:hypothetical protein